MDTLGQDTFKTFSLRMIPDLKALCSLGDTFVLAETSEGFDFRSLNSSKEIGPIFREPMRVEFASCIIIRQGWLRFRLNLKEYRLCQNDAGVVMPGDFSQCLEISGDCRIIFIAFSDNRYIPIANGQQLSTVVSFFKRNPVYHIGKERLDDMVYIFGIMRRRILDPECREKETIVRGWFHALLQESICEIKSEEAKTVIDKRSRSEEILVRFMELLRENYLNERSTAFYADKLCLTPKHLSGVIKAASGKHVREWIQEYLLLEAKAMLQTHRYSVQEISIRLNFANQSFFGTWFKKAAGLSPRKYMALHCPW